MLGRRSLRIKVMQVLFGLEMNPDIPLASLEGDLEKSMARSLKLYLTDLAYLIDVCEYSMVDAARRMARHVKTEADKNISTQIAANAVVQFLKTNPRFQTYCKTEKIHNYVSQDVVKDLFVAWSSKPKYKEYAALAKPTAEQDIELLSFLVKKILATNEELEAHLEEFFMNYSDDQQLLTHVLLKYLENFDATNENALMEGISAWETEQKFARDLLRQYVAHSEELAKDIEPNLANWDMDRIAVLDLVIMKLAICELKYFPTVPVKVSINEYIDISKLYSTPKSKDFVNGVLDKTRKQLQEAGAIKKQGRGLVE
ncbi:MAG: transcription antitermination factor NusB [Chitinophagales bacterium]